MNGRVSATRATLRRLGGVPLVLRAVVAVMAATAIAATTVPAWDAPDGYVGIAVLAALVYVLAPTRRAASSSSARSWSRGWPARRAGRPAVVVAALALLVGHVAAALAGSMPVTAHADARVGAALGAADGCHRRRRARHRRVLAVLDATSLPGSAIVILAALGAVTAAAWRWSAPD